MKTYQTLYLTVRSSTYLGKYTESVRQQFESFSAWNHYRDNLKEREEGKGKKNHIMIGLGNGKAKESKGKKKNDYDDEVKQNSDPK